MNLFIHDICFFLKPTERHRKETETFPHLTGNSFYFSQQQCGRKNVFHPFSICCCWEIWKLGSCSVEQRPPSCSASSWIIFHLPVATRPHQHRPLLSFLFSFFLLQLCFQPGRRLTSTTACGSDSWQRRGSCSASSTCKRTGTNG